MANNTSTPDDGVLPPLSEEFKAEPHWWIIIERDDDQGEVDQVIGAYPHEQSGELAMNESVFIQGMCEESALEVYLVRESLADIYARYAADGFAEPEVTIVDLDDYHFTGLPNPEDEQEARS